MRKSYKRMLVAAKRGVAKDTIKRVVIGKAIIALANERGLSRARMAKIVGDAASQMSRLMTGHFGEFSVDRLAEFWVKLGGSIDVTLTRPTHNSRKRGRAEVRVA